MHAVALAAELGHPARSSIPRAADVFTRLGDADERPPPRLLPHPPDDADAERRRELDALRRARPRRGASTQFASEGIDAERGPLRPLRRTSATRTRSTASRCRSRTARSTPRRSRGSPSASTTPTSASTPTGSTRRSSSSACTSSPIAEVGKLEPAPLPVTGRPLGDALEGRARGRLRARGRPHARHLRRRAARAGDGSSTGRRSSRRRAAHQARARRRSRAGAPRTA